MGRLKKIRRPWGRDQGQRVLQRDDKLGERMSGEEKGGNYIQRKLSRKCQWENQEK